MSWLLLLFAIALEVLALIAMKESEGLRRFAPTLMIFLLVGLSLAAEAVALRRIGLMQAYVVWMGVGTVLAVLVAVFHFEEPFSVPKGLFILLVLAGTLGLGVSR